MSGNITVQHTIWCGLCAAWDQLSGSSREAVKEWREAGWRRTKENGWVCPQHPKGNKRS